jgi:hypothetical protein
MKKFLALLAFLPLLATAQVNVPVPGGIFPNAVVKKNFTINTSAVKNKLNITDASTIVTRTVATDMGESSYFTIDATSSGQIVEFLASPIDADLIPNAACQGGLTVNGDASLYKIYLKDGSGNKSAEKQLESYTNAKGVTTQIVPCATGHRTVIESTGNGAAIKVKKVVVGESLNIGTTAQATYWGGINLAANGANTCSFTGPTSSGNNDFQTLNVGTGCAAWTVKSPGNVTAVATNNHAAVITGTGEMNIKIKGGIYDGNPNQICNYRLTDGTTSYQPQYIYAGGTSGSTTVNMLDFHVSKTVTGPVTYSLQVASGSGGNCGIDNTVTGRNLAWDVYRFPSVDEQVVRFDQSNYEPRPYTATITGGGTVTGLNCTEARRGVMNLIDCTFTTGTATATEARLSLPYGRVVKSTVPTLSRALGGYAVGSVGGGATYSKAVLKEPSVSYVTFGVGITSTGDLVKANGSAAWGNSLLVSVQFEVPIEGWTENQDAPAQKGSAFTTGPGRIKIESITFGGSGLTSDCSTDPCPYMVKTDGIINAGLTTTGNYAIRFTPGVFPVNPTCTCGGFQYNTGNVDCVPVVQSFTPNLAVIRTRFSTNNTDVNAQVNVICTAPF